MNQSKSRQSKQQKRKFQILETSRPSSIILMLPDGQEIHITALPHRDGTVLQINSQNTDHDVIDLHKKEHLNSIEIMVGARVDVDI